MDLLTSSATAFTAGNWFVMLSTHVSAVLCVQFCEHFLWYHSLASLEWVDNATFIRITKNSVPIAHTWHCLTVSSVEINDSGFRLQTEVNFSHCFYRFTQQMAWYDGIHIWRLADTIRYIHLLSCGVVSATASTPLKAVEIYYTWALDTSSLAIY
jgi:hypothetical protein